jgi:hypothetical protein
MNRFKVMAIIFCLILVALAFPSRVEGDERNKKTIVTFNEPIEIPGVGDQVLPAGTYVFKLMDSSSDRNIVQIFNECENRLYATILTIPNYRLRPTNKTVITFHERPGASPQAIRAWFYPGANSGHEFVYPKERAVELAKLTNLPVLAMPTNLASNIIVPVKSVDEAPVIALKKATVEAVKPTGEEVRITEVVEPPPPVQITAAETPQSTERLPQTASPILPLLRLIGLPILAMPTNLASNIIVSAKSVDEAPVIALKKATVEAVKPTREEVRITEVRITGVVEPPPPVQITAAETPQSTERLPRTASPILPLLGLIGLLSLAAGVALSVIPNRAA